MKRLHDLDALRATAMLLGVLLHAVFHIIPWRYFSSHTLPGGPNVWALPYFHMVQIVHGFRMPLFFLLSGYFSALLWQRRGLRGLLKNRLMRIALPLLVGIPTIRNLEYILNMLQWGENPTTAEWWRAIFQDLSLLWFLWHLLLILGLFLLLSALGLRFRSRLWWLLLPAAWIPAIFMSQDFLIFGPETAVAVLVEPPVPGFYACFFFFGVFWFRRGFEFQGRWALAILPAILLVYPAAIPLIFVHPRLLGATQLPGSLLETCFAWLMCFGMLGLFRSIVVRERPWLRSLAEASYWIYLTHELVMQILSPHIWRLTANPHLHFLLLTLLASGILYFVWMREVRFSWIGTLLNGRRERPHAEQGYSTAIPGGR